jgi:hypothetical protein
MKKDLVFVCRKCEHNLFLVDGVNLIGKEIARKLNHYCPSCGEEAGDLWIYSRQGNYDKEYGEK